MANKNCNACNEIRSEVPELVTNGFTEAMCTSMKNDTGLKPSDGNDDCEDLGLLNDCLVGNMKDEIEDYDGCDWKDFTKKFADNLWTMFAAVKCAICGLWTNVHNLWDTVRSFKLTKSGHTITLTSNLGNHGSVTDDDTTYSLSKSGNTITLTGSDGTTDSVTDSNTTYTMTISGHTITLTPSSGSAQSVTVPDNDTKYGLSISGHTISIVENGTTEQVTVPDNNTTYGLSRSGDTITLVPGGTNMSVNAPDTNTWKANTSSSEGYVRKGEDDPHAVWATGEDGAPTWRHNPTLSGSLTLYDHSGAIGETIYWPQPNTSSADTIGNNVDYKRKTSITLTPGKWICFATIGYEFNSVGDRALGLTFGNGSHHEGVYVKASQNNMTILSKGYIRVVEEGTTEDVYLCGRQNSGGTLNISDSPDTYVYCIRIC